MPLRSAGGWALLGNFVVLGGYVFLEFDGFSPIFVAGKGEDLVYQFKDFRSGAVAFEERVSFYCPGVIFEEASEDLGRTAAPAVDGLLQVADDEEASSLRVGQHFLDQRPHDIPLRPAGVLEFVDQDVLDLGP